MESRIVTCYSTAVFIQTLGAGGKVTSAGWQVTLCDPIWHVISRSGVVISITNCYISVYFLVFYPAAVTFPSLPQPKLVLDLATLGGYKAELIWVVVTSQDNLPAKDGHLSQK